MSKTSFDLSTYISFLRNECHFSANAVEAMQIIAGGTERKFLQFCRNGKYRGCREFYDTLDALDYLDVDLPEIDRVPSISNLRDLAKLRLNELKEKFNIVFAIECGFSNKCVVIYLPSLKKLRDTQNEIDLREILDD